MKHKYLIIALALMAISCGKSSQEETQISQPAEYIGTVSVEYDGTTYNNENISVNYTPSEDGASAQILIRQIKFVPQMPVSIDVTVPDIAVEAQGSVFTLSCDNVVPLALGGPMERYLVTDLTGTLQGENLSFSLNFGAYPTRFIGKIQ